MNKPFYIPNLRSAGPVRPIMEISKETMAKSRYLEWLRRYKLKEYIEIMARKKYI